MLVHQMLHLTLVQLLLWTLMPTVSTSIPNPVPSPSLLERPASNLILPSNGSFTNPNVLPADPSYVPWPSTGLNLGVVKLFNYGDPISPFEANQVLTELARVYHGQPPNEHCGTVRRTYTASTVALVLNPSPDLTWGSLARAGYIFPLFFARYEYVGFKFEIWGIEGVFLGGGYIA
ncbi:hypothetical protein JMJ35_002323 [Cladonia borealis]|uniref:Uncharacterized protein n=1 Tax=Cladonia borealis TaxID=184061 RepID=A0AA39R750_9LECA|nr:hypothetical protein JMJ35_002323 [Cladonia borealis]